MPSRKYVTPIERLKEQACAIVKANNDARYLHRVECVNLVLHGMTPSTLSGLVREGKNTITSWVKIADEKGFEALKIKEYPGRPEKLNPEQLEAIRAAVAEDPEKHGFRVWDGPALSSFIDTKFKIAMSVRQCQRLFHKLNFSLLRPRTMPTKGEDNQEQREKFKKKFQG